MEKHVYFVRHGQTDSNIEHIYRGKDAQLTDSGREQARTVAERVARLNIQAIISSTLPRAVETANIISERTGLTPERNGLFAEWREPTHIQGVHSDHATARSTFEAIHAAIDPDYRHTDEENFSEMLVRAESVLHTLEEHSAERICVIAHNGFLRVLIGRLVFQDLFNKTLFIAFLRNAALDNTSITYARYTPDRSWQLVTWNDQSHLG